MTIVSILGTDLLETLFMPSLSRTMVKTGPDEISKFEVFGYPPNSYSAISHDPHVHTANVFVGDDQRWTTFSWVIFKRLLSLGILDPDIWSWCGILGILDPGILFLGGILGILDPEALALCGILGILDPEALVLCRILVDLGS